MASPPIAWSPPSGCSFANHLALAALVSPGDEVLVEAPTYELLTSTLRLPSGSICAVSRGGLRRVGDSTRRRSSLTPATRLVVLTNLHNPSSALADPTAVAAIAGAAANIGARVFIDEVYLELTAEAGAVRTAFRPGWEHRRHRQPDQGLRAQRPALRLDSRPDGAGRADAAPERPLRRRPAARRRAPQRHRFRQAWSNFAPAPEACWWRTAPPTAPSWVAILASNRSVFDHGTTVFPRLARGDGDAFFERLKSRFETTVVPGRFFGAPGSHPRRTGRRPGRHPRGPVAPGRGPRVLRAGRALAVSIGGRSIARPYQDFTSSFASERASELLYTVEWRGAGAGQRQRNWRILCGLSTSWMRWSRSLGS